MRLILLGSVVAMLGAAALWFGGIPYTDREDVLDIGPFQASAEVRKRIDIPPLAGGAIMALGVGILVYGAARRRD
jgi:hypothetical protein